MGMAGRQDEAPLAGQGIGAADWLEPSIAALAQETNEKVRALADRELEPSLSPGDFLVLLAAAARRAEADADR
jgi:hypothetical protein